MMVKNIISKNYDAIHSIPTNVLKKILTENHGKEYASKIIKSKKINKKDIDDIEFSKDEIDFFKHLKFISNSKNHEKYIFSKFKETSITYENMIDIINKYSNYLDNKDIVEYLDVKYIFLITKNMLNKDLEIKNFEIKDFDILKLYMKTNKNTNLNITNVFKYLVQNTSNISKKIKYYFDTIIDMKIENGLNFNDACDINIIDYINSGGITSICMNDIIDKGYFINKINK
jgi:hypothetical protein